ncbi:MAG: hypothetical protein EOO30_21190, partial [Comamonadaceae bacterium]
MEKVVHTGAIAASRWETPLRASAAALLTLLSASAAHAQEASPPPEALLVLEARPQQPPMRLKVESSALPRLDAQDSGFQAPRLDLSVVPENARGTGFGPVLGVRTMPTQVAPGSPGLAAARSGVDLGLRFSHRFQNDNQIDVTAWRRMNGPDDAYSLIQMREPVYGARVEMKMNIKPAKFNAFGIDRGLLGFQLESGARISIKRK